MPLSESMPCHHGDVDATRALTPRRSTAKHLLRVLVALAAGVGLAYLLLVSILLATVKCGDTCGGSDTEHWRWTAQFVLAVMVVAMGAAALVLGFTSRTRTYRALLVLSIGSVLAWMVWVLGFGDF